MKKLLFTLMALVLMSGLFLTVASPAMAVTAVGAVTPNSVANDGVSVLHFTWDIFDWSGTAAYYTFGIYHPGNLTPIYIQYSDGAGVDNFPGISGPLTNSVNGIVGAPAVHLLQPEAPATHNWTVPSTLPVGLYWAFANLYLQGESSPTAGAFISFQIVHPAIDLIKYVSVNNQSSWEDANVAPGDNALVGQNVYFKFHIQNTGGVTLTGITLTDSVYNLSGITPALPASLAAGATYDGILGPIAAAAGQHTDTGNATGYWNSNPVSDTDPANYFGGNLTIDLIKYVSVNNQSSWEDANVAPGDNALVGQNVYFKFHIVNNSNVPLTGITLTDSVYNLSGITPALPASLAVGATYDGIIGPIAAAAGQHTDTGNATGYWNSNPVSDTDPANYFGGNLTIDLIKYVSVNNQSSWEDANVAPGDNALVGQNVYFKFHIVNNSNVPLTGITLTDSVYNLSGITPALPASLAVGATYDGIIGPIAAAAGQHTDTGNATGYWNSNPVSDTDPANYFGGNLTIDLIKYVSVNNQSSWEDANVAPGDNALVGQNVYFKFHIVNNSNVPLTGITLTDSVYNLSGIIPALPASLAVGATYDGIIGPIAATAGQHTDTGNATGYWNSNPVSDTDPANYFGSTPCVNLEKLVNGEDADSPTGPVVLVGSTVTFDFFVENCGNVALTNLVVTDSVYGAIGNISTLVVGGNQTLTIQRTAEAGQHTNMGNVTTAQGATDEDAGNYFGNNPCIDVTKTANPTEGEPGDTITYTIKVCNCGNVGLGNVTVVDTLLGDLSAYFSDTLAVGACESHGNFTRVILDTDTNPLRNCVTVHANPIGSTQDVTDTDCANVKILKARCRITGGGTIGTDREPRVTHGFELHCDVNQLPNRLEVNWGGNSFHLLKLTKAICTDDPAIMPDPPRAACDTYHGWGEGRYNGVKGYTAEWIFTDAGEPGVNDWAWIKITDANGTVVLEVSGFLTYGNQQFHNCTGKDLR